MVVGKTAVVVQLVDEVVEDAASTMVSHPEICDFRM